MYVDNKEQVQIEQDDQCYSCKHFSKEVSCPLLEALALGVVILVHDTQVQNCSFFKDKHNHLRIVKGK